MARVDHDDLEAGALAQSRSACVRFDDLLHHLLIQALHRDAVGTDAVGRAVLDQPLLLRLIRHVGACVHAGVGELQTGHRAVAADRVGGVGRGAERVQDARVQTVRVRAVGLVDHEFRDVDDRGAASGAQLIKSHGLRADTAVVRDVGAAHGSGAHPVPERNAVDLNRRAQVRKFARVHSDPLSFRIYLQCPSAGQCFVLYGFCEKNQRNVQAFIIEKTHTQIL